MTTNNKIDNYVVNDFVITFINDSYLYNNYIKRTCMNLAQKQLKGTYNKQKAIKAFLPVVKEGLKAYAVKFASGQSWYTLATPTERLAIAELILEDCEDLIQTYKEDLEDK